MDFFRKSTAKKNADQKGNLTEGPIAKGLFTFMIPIFLGQLLQQLYNMADAWVCLLYTSILTITMKSTRMGMERHPTASNAENVSRFVRSS